MAEFVHSNMTDAFNGPVRRINNFNVETLTGDVVVSKRASQLQVLDAGGTARNWDLWNPSDTEEGYAIEVVNTGGEVITVRKLDAAGSATNIVALAAGSRCVCAVVGGAWVGLFTQTGCAAI